MTLPPFADATTLATRIPGGLGDDVARAEAALEDASSAIRSLANRSWCDVAGDELDWGTLALEHQDEVIRVCLAVAARAFANPDAVTQESTATGPFTHGRSFGNSSPDVYLNGSEKASIRRAVASLGAVPGLGVLKTTRGHHVETAPVRDRWLDMQEACDEWLP